MINRIKLIFAVITAVMGICVCSVSAERLMLEYDGGVYEYSGAVYDLVVKNKKVYPALEPIIFNDRALVPVRDVFEEVGATVNYRQETQTIEVYDDDTYVRLRINDNIAYVNGAKTMIPDSVVPKLISKLGGETKTMVPVRFISETIGLDVEFDGNNGAILVESVEYPQATPEPTAAPTAAPTESPAPTAEPVPTEEPVIVSDISYQNVEDGKIAITVKMNKKAEYSYFTMSDPQRFVVDIKNARFTEGERTLYIHNGGIQAVRVGVNSERTRVVVDMDSIVSYGFGNSGNNLIIYVKASQAEVSATATPVPTPSPTKSPNKVYTKNLIALDAGHGGYDPGAQGTLNGKTVNESDLTLQITYKVKEILERNGYSVLLTRSDDTYKTLTERPELANNKNVALFVSIHINSVDNAPTAKGTEVYYAESNNSDFHGVTSSLLAKNILSCMIDSMGSVNRGVKTAEHAVTKRSDMPACLAEVGFITNADEIAKMSDSAYQYKVATGIANGIMKTAQQMN